MTRRLLTVWAVVTACSGTACTVNQAEVPALTGPSDFARSVAVTATPDTLLLNGQQSVVIVEAHDSTGAPLANLRVHADVLVGGVASLCGGLSPTEFTTGVGGRASAVFTAPTLPLPMPECQSLAGSVTIRAFPFGTNAQTTKSFSASINLLTPSSSSPSNTFAVNFSISPNPGTVSPALITFADAGSVSPGHTITSYSWTWSDGAAKSGASVAHDFGAKGIYTVTLTITDDIGQTGFKTALVTIN